MPSTEGDVCVMRGTQWAVWIVSGSGKTHHALHQLLLIHLHSLGPAIPQALLQHIHLQTRPKTQCIQGAAWRQFRHKTKPTNGLACSKRASDSCHLVLPVIQPFTRPLARTASMLLQQRSCTPCGLSALIQVITVPCTQEQCTPHHAHMQCLTTDTRTNLLQISTSLTDPNDMSVGFTTDIVHVRLPILGQIALPGLAPCKGVLQNPQPSIRVCKCKWQRDATKQN